MQLHQLQRQTARKFQKRVGRGGKRGKTSGRGTKGQKARAGHRIMPAIREQLKKLPKLRGYKLKSIEEKPLVVNIASLEATFSAGDTINPSVLIERGVVRARKGEVPAIKILGDGELKKKFTVSGCILSASAREKIEKAGGTIAQK
jgi:large subunit ribosomal protein L15